MEKQLVASKWDEITQLEVAYDALKTQDRPAQLRMLEWLSARTAHDYKTAMEVKEAATRARIAVSASGDGK